MSTTKGCVLPRERLLRPGIRLKRGPIYTVKKGKKKIRRRRKSRLIYIINLSPVSIGDTKFRQSVGVFVGEKSHLFIARKG